MSNYAVVKTGGKQYLVREGDEIYVDRINEENGKSLTLVRCQMFPLVFII